jgi:hypothetical protein
MMSRSVASPTASRTRTATPTPDPADAHRARGATHHQALRALANRPVGILHGCLRHHTAYNETTAWSHHHTDQAAA